MVMKSGHDKRLVLLLNKIGNLSFSVTLSYPFNNFIFVFLKGALVGGGLHLDVSSASLQRGRYKLRIL